MFRQPVTARSLATARNVTGASRTLAALDDTIPRHCDIPSPSTVVTVRLAGAFHDEFGVAELRRQIAAVPPHGRVVPRIRDTAALARAVETLGRYLDDRPDVAADLALELVDASLRDVDTLVTLPGRISAHLPVVRTPQSRQRPGALAVRYELGIEAAASGRAFVRNVNVSPSPAWETDGRPSYRAVGDDDFAEVAEGCFRFLPDDWHPSWRPPTVSGHGDALLLAGLVGAAHNVRRRESPRPVDHRVLVAHAPGFPGHRGIVTRRRSTAARGGAAGVRP